MKIKTAAISILINFLLLGSKSIADVEAQLDAPVVTTAGSQKLQTPPLPMIIDQESPKEDIKQSEYEAAQSATTKLKEKISLVKQQLSAENSEIKAERQKTSSKVHELGALQIQLKYQMAKLRKERRALAAQKGETHRIRVQISKIKTKLAKYITEQNKLEIAKTAKISKRGVASQQN
jgi:hypothetical protein